MATLTVEREERVDVARAWRDEAYYLSLTDDQRAQVPAHPAGGFDPTTDLKRLTRVPVACLADPATCVIFHTVLTGNIPTALC